MRILPSTAGRTPHILRNLYAKTVVVFMFLGNKIILKINYKYLFRSQWVICSALHSFQNPSSELGLTLPNSQPLSFRFPHLNFWELPMAWRMSQVAPACRSSFSSPTIPLSQVASCFSGSCSQPSPCLECLSLPAT